MKHYFYFKKGQPVPTWLFRPTNPDVSWSMAFTANGKVMVDDETGKATIWPTDRYYRSIITGNGSPFDCGGPNFTNSMWAYGHLSFLDPKLKHKLIAPLVSSRRSGNNICTTTKCIPIPEKFERLNDNT